MNARPEPPRVSVVVPCRNDAASLPLVLAALERQTYPRERSQILVVDNGSTDGSWEAAAAFPVERLREPVRSAYRARNRGIAAATGEYVLFLDADTVPGPEWIAELVGAAQAAGSWLAGGRIENEAVRPALGSALLALARPAEQRRAAIERAGRLSGGNMLVARAAFDRYGVFLPVQSGGDGEFSQRANPERRPVPYAERAWVVHRCDVGTWAYLGRAFRIAKGQARTGGTAVPVPWRPGVRRAREIQRQLPAGVSASWLRVLAVLWLERWFFFCGDRAGRWTGKPA
ncbi:MAG: glycosyltransferase family 2 protein [Kiritimatiellia bacterium]